MKYVILYFVIGLFFLWANFRFMHLIYNIKRSDVISYRQKQDIKSFGWMTFFLWPVAVPMGLLIIFFMNVGNWIEGAFRHHEKERKKL